MKTVIHMLATLSVIGIISGGVLSQIFGWAEPLIEENRRKETQAAILEVQPKAANTERVEGVAQEIYKLFNENEELIGYGLVFEGNGFQGPIRMMIGLTPELDQTTGLRVLEHIETPGLGTIITEPWYYEQYEGLKTVPEIGTVKEGTEPAENQIQTKTGATISTKAVAKIVNDGINTLRNLKEKGEL